MHEPVRRPSVQEAIPALHRPFINRVLEELASLDVDKALKIAFCQIPRSILSRFSIPHPAREEYLSRCMQRPVFSTFGTPLRMMA